jgi:benzoyl-CoA reductase/2-hydroxyglutaryl-CoA dehydratase subunit BcrC/BadD/HgdB
VLIFFVFVASLYFSVVISGQRRQIENLVEEIALLDQRLREAEREGTSGR